jgi:hypothetical protein
LAAAFCRLDLGQALIFHRGKQRRCTDITVLRQGLGLVLRLILKQLDVRAIAAADHADLFDDGARVDS